MFWFSRAAPVSRCSPPSLPGKNCLVVSSVAYSPSPGPLWVLINLIEGGALCICTCLQGCLLPCLPGAISGSSFSSHQGCFSPFISTPPLPPLGLFGWLIILDPADTGAFSPTNPEAERLSSASRGIAHRSCGLEPRLSKSGGSGTTWGWAEKALPPPAWTSAWGKASLPMPGNQYPVCVSMCQSHHFLF